MREKNQEYYQKLVLSGQWKKVSKAMAQGSEQEKVWMLDTMGKKGASSDECYNQLVQALQGAQDKPTKLAAIAAMGQTKRSAATSQLEYMAAHTEDAEILSAITAARHALR
jgi:uncharacterized protein YcnI